MGKLHIVAEARELADLPCMRRMGTASHNVGSMYAWGGALKIVDENRRVYAGENWGRFDATAPTLGKR